jgi:hypothetical protein
MRSNHTTPHKFTFSTELGSSKLALNKEGRIALLIYVKMHKLCFPFPYQKLVRPEPRQETILKNTDTLSFKEKSQGVHHCLSSLVVDFRDKN